MTTPENPSPDETPPEQVPSADADPMAAMLGGLDLGSLMETAQQMQQQMADAQSQLAATQVEGSAGGGKVRVTITGDLQPVGVRLDPDVIDPDDAELLEDLILAAWRDAVAEVGRAEPSGDPMGGLDLGSMGIDPAAFGIGGDAPELETDPEGSSEDEG